MTTAITRRAALDAPTGRRITAAPAFATIDRASCPSARRHVASVVEALRG